MQARETKALRKITVKRIITYALIGMLYVVILLSVGEVAYRLYLDIITPPVIFLEIDQLLDLLGMFLLILVAIELLDTVKAYLDEDVVHVEVVLEAAMIAVARKIIILNIKEVSAPAILGIAALLLGLSASFFVVKHLHAGKLSNDKSH